MLLLEELIEHGYEATESISEAFYILADGTLWEGCFDSGTRGYDHREVETFTYLDRYDGDEFWQEVFLRHKLILVIPETKQLMIHPEQTFTNPQVEMIAYAVKRGYEVVKYE